MSEKVLVDQIRTACAGGGELLSFSVLCESIGSIGLRDPIVIPTTAVIQDGVDILQREKIGSVLIVDDDGRIRGIFTERDCVLKVIGKFGDLRSTPITAVMTANPVCEHPETTIAYALNLMSHGGFRNLPIVDTDNFPIGVVSVKDVVDFLVGKMMEGVILACGIAQDPGV